MKGRFGRNHAKLSKMASQGIDGLGALADQQIAGAKHDRCGTGQTIEFRLSAKCDKLAAGRFFRRALGRENTRNPRIIVTEQLTSDPGALRDMKREDEPWRLSCQRRGRWRNNRIEQEHRRIKRRTWDECG